MNMVSAGFANAGITAGHKPGAMYMSAAQVVAWAVRPRRSTPRTPEIEMEDINVKCCRCRNTHLHSARKESAPDRYGMRTLVCPRCGAKEFYKPEPKKGQPQPSGD